MSAPESVFQRAGFSSRGNDRGTDHALDVRVLKTYSGRGQAGFTLEADFQVQPGFTVLVGPSGTGKSTLLRCIAGLTDPDKGRITIGHRVLFDSDEGTSVVAAQRRVAFVFQHLALFPHLSVEENVAYGIRRLPRDQKEARITAVLESFRIAHLRTQIPKQISGGEQQRVALARALVTEPAVLLLDEPLSSLDVHNKASIIEDLQKWNAAHNVPVLYVTHNQEEMFALGEHVIVFDPGGVMSEGLPIGTVPRRENPGASDFDNLVDATVLRQLPDHGTMQCQIGGTRFELEVPRRTVPTGSDIVIRIPAHEIVLATAPPELLGAINILQGQIQQVEPMGQNFQLRVQCGGLELRTELPPDALQGIRAPGRVWLIIPPHACHFERISRLRPLQRLFVFVCGGNTSRSPLAQAICNAEVARRLRMPLDALGQLPIRAVSAGTSANAGTPVSEEAQMVLQAMDLPRLQQTAQNLTAELVTAAEAIFCMTAEQCQQIVAMFPHAAAKVHRLDPESDIEDPHGAGERKFRELASRLRMLIDMRLADSGFVEQR